MKGMKYFNEVYWHLKVGGEKDLSLIINSCRKSLKYFRSKKLKNQKKFKQLSKDEFIFIHENLRHRYPDSYKALGKIFNLSNNPLLDCELRGSSYMNAGVFFHMSFGYDYFICQTPLGRRFLTFGPSFGVGVGLCSLSLNLLQKRIKFKIPMKDNTFLKYSYNSESEIMFIGTSNYNQKKIYLLNLKDMKCYLKIYKIHFLTTVFKKI